MDQFIHWWQYLPEHINPIVFSMGALQIRYYGLMYASAFLVIYVLLRWRLKHESFSYAPETLDDYLFWSILGAVIGARLGYVLFYQFAYYVTHPLEIIVPFDIANGFEYVGISGMSYHGGLIGVALSTVLFCRKRKIGVWAFADFFVPAVPLGYAFGRLGNFLNGELYGRVTSVAWGMYFPQAPSVELRHPSQLYEMILEGLVLFVVLWSLRNKKLFDGYIFPIYLMGYGLVRFIIEFYRQPDAHIGFIAGQLSLGQVLCLVMIGVGIGLFFYLKDKAQKV